jgi:hypothetical protein
MVQPGRKSIWQNTTFVDETNQQGLPANLPIPQSVVEQLRVAEEKQRDRSWERQNRSFLVRGVPPALTMAVKEIAVTLNVRADDVARAFLEYGLFCYQRGEIKLMPVLSNQRLTLFPQPETAWQVQTRPGWIEKLWDVQPPAKTNPKQKRQEKTSIEKPWRWQVSYRGIPEDVKTSLRQLRQQNSVPLGEVVSAFMGHAWEAYQAGRLVLNPQPQVAGSLNATFSQDDEFSPLRET